MSPSGVGHSYNMCHHLAVLAYLVRVRERERERELDRERDRECERDRERASSTINCVS